VSKGPLVEGTAAPEKNGPSAGVCPPRLLLLASSIITAVRPGPPTTLLVPPTPPLPFFNSSLSVPHFHQASLPSPVPLYATYFVFYSSRASIDAHSTFISPADRINLPPELSLAELSCAAL
jgi:hypothetical protein